MWRKQLENVSQAEGNALQEETQRLICQKRDGMVPELKFISKFTGLKWQTLKAYLSWQCKTKWETMAGNQSQSNAPGRRLTFLTERMTDECDGFSLFWWLHIKAELSFKYASSWVQCREKWLQLDDLWYIHKVPDPVVYLIVPSGLNLYSMQTWEINLLLHRFYR